MIFTNRYFLDYSSNMNGYEYSSFFFVSSVTIYFLSVIWILTPGTTSSYFIFVSAMYII